MKKADFSLPLWEQEIPYFLPQAETPNRMTVHLLETDRPLPCLVICPGGGFQQLTKPEGEPVAAFFGSQGLHTVVVEYRIRPNRHPAPICDAQRAIQLVRRYAAEWRVDPNRIVTVGFSAGGHVAAGCAVMPCFTRAGRVPDAADAFSSKPNGAVLAYPVIELGGSFGHVGSGRNLLGERYEEEQEAVSLIHLVDSTTPPCFLWHTADDSIVDVRNSIAFSTRLQECGVSFALHVYPFGDHGRALAEEVPELSQWKYAAADWVKERIGGRKGCISKA